MKSKTLYVSVALNVFLVVLILTMLLRNKEQAWQKWIKYKGSASLVMFGDSHVARGEWNSLINDQSVLRLGWGGFTSDQLKGLVHFAIDYKPEKVLILCGGNDIRSRCFSVNNTVTNLKFMADALSAHNITPVFQKLIYRQNNPEYNSMIDSINFQLSSYCTMEKLQLIDIGQNMYGSNGLKPTLTDDGIHLNDEGYDLWASEINEFLEKNK